MEALYSLSYALKFMVKKGQGIDYAVLPLEGLWWAEDMEAFNPERLDKDRWQWTLIIRQPEQVTPELFGQALEQVKKKKPLPYLARVRWGTLHEGLSAQILHVGPFSEEHATIQKIHAFVGRPRVRLQWQASRNLFKRSPQDRSGKTEDRHPAADKKVLRRFT